METQTGARHKIKVGRTEMPFTHEGRVLTAVHPFYGPANSLNLLENIRREGYVESTAPQIASFVHEYFSRDEPQAEEVQGIVENNFFRGFTGVLYVPGDNGKGLAYFIDNPEFDGNSCINRDNLLSRMDESRAQVSFEHLKRGYVPWNKVAKNPYFVAWAGEEGAGKLAELASKRSSKEAYIWVPKVSGLNEPEARVALLGSGWIGDRLDIGSDGHGNNRSTCAFGVVKDAEGIALKNE